MKLWSLPLVLAAVQLVLLPGLAAQGPIAFRVDEQVCFEGSTTESLLGSERGNTVALGPGGEIFVARNPSPAVLRFAADGRFVGRIGREGEGPGEFRWAALLGFRGDTLWVYDHSLRRMGMFTREGQFIRYVATSTLLLRFGSAFAAIGLLEDGTIVGSASYKSGRRGGAGRLPVVAIDPGDGFTAASVDTLTTFFDADSRYVVDLPGIGTAVTSSPLDTSWFWVPDPLGDGIVTVDQPGIGGAPPDRYTVRWIGSDGAQRRAVSRGVEQVPLRGDIRNSVLESEVAKNVEGFDPSLERGPVERSVRRSLPLPDDLPAVSSLLAGTDGSVWVRREFHPGQPWTWDLFGRDGYVGSVRVPDHVTPQVVTLASMWGVELDPLDVPCICRFTVQAMPGDPP